MNIDFSDFYVDIFDIIEDPCVNPHKICSNRSSSIESSSSIKLSESINSLNCKNQDFQIFSNIKINHLMTQSCESFKKEDLCISLKSNASQEDVYDRDY